MQSPQTKSGQRKLSEIARHVCRPEGMVSTGFPAVRDRALAMGMPMDPWQEGVARLALAKRASGLYAAGIGGVVLSIPRQVGKTYLIAAIVFALCTIFPSMTVIWTAHRTRTHNETFKKMQGMSRKSKIAPYVENVRATNGEQEIAFKNGSRIMFGARESGFGRGFDMVDILVLDEAQILSEDAMSDMVPATNAAPNGLVFLMGTPPRPKDPGEVFTNLRKAALAGDPDTLYVEFSADQDASLDDRKQLAKANPSYPHRTSEAAILRMRKLLGSDDSFKREAYGIWDPESTVSIFAAGKWEATSRKDRPDGLAVNALAVAVSIDLAYSAIVAASVDGDDVWVKVLHHQPGTRGIVARCKELQDMFEVDVVVDGRGPGAALIPDLEKLDARVHVASTSQVLDAFALMEIKVRDGEFLHVENHFLDRAAEGAVKREVGDRNALGRKKSEADICALEAAELAAWWACSGDDNEPDYATTGVMTI